MLEPQQEPTPMEKTTGLTPNGKAAPQSRLDSQPTDESEKRDEDSSSDRARSSKRLAILDACKSGDIQALRDLALSDEGFLSDEVRHRAWPILLGHNGVDSDLASTPWEDLERHKEEDQVQLDVDRSFIYYPNRELVSWDGRVDDPAWLYLEDVSDSEIMADCGSSIDQSQAQLDKRKTELSNLITETLRRHPYLCYFQGYHDICQVFLLVLPPNLRVQVVARLSILRIRDFHLPSMLPTLAQLPLITDILRTTDIKLYRHLSDTQPFFALSGTLTMYAHDITEYGDIARLFDALLAREQVFTLYLFAQIILNRRDELFDTPANEPEMLHSILSKLPQPLQLDRLITQASELYDLHPPETLPRWRSVPSASVLKTARDVEACSKQTLQDGERFFRKQVRDMQWFERKQQMLKTAWAYRRPLGSITLAVLVGAVAVYVGRSPGVWAYLAAFWSRRP